MIANAASFVTTAGAGRHVRAPLGRPIGRSIAAIVGGLLTTAVLALVVDIILHAVGVFPPWGQPYFGAGPYLLAVGYRSVFNVVGFLVAARLAPRQPLRHVAVLAGIGFTLSLLSLLATKAAAAGPQWYPVALALMTFPSAALARALIRRAPRCTARA